VSFPKLLAGDVDSNLPQWEAHGLDVMPGQHPAVEIEGHANGRRATEVGFSGGGATVFSGSRVRQIFHLL
jgi:hypothetical protein